MTVQTGKVSKQEFDRHIDGMVRAIEGIMELLVGRTVQQHLYWMTPARIYSAAKLFSQDESRTMDELRLWLVKERHESSIGASRHPISMGWAIDDLLSLVDTGRPLLDAANCFQWPQVWDAIERAAIKRNLATLESENTRKNQERLIEATKARLTEINQLRREIADPPLEKLPQYEVDKLARRFGMDPKEV